MKQMSIDIETYSDVDLSSCGVYRYSESDEFEILLFGYSIDGGEVEVVDVAGGETIPAFVVEALFSKNITKWAFNASFERICLSAYLRKVYPDRMTERFLNPDSWKCTMIWSGYAGFPMSLKTAGEAMNLSDQKMDEGKGLIRYFSVPCAPTKTNSGRTRNLPKHAPDMWETFRAYNRRDVEVELSIQRVLANFPVPDMVWDEYHIDQEINDRGIRVDLPLVEEAIRFDERSKAELTKEIQNLTGLENPNSVQQMKCWLKSRGIQANSIDKKAVNDLIMDTEDPVVKRALVIRKQLAKSSVKKYIAMKNAICADGRVHGMFQFYGANRTGRWAGRYINLQNLPQNHIPDLNEAREMVRCGDYEMFCMLYDSVPSVLSELTRTAFIPADGYKFIVADYSAIEARVLSYLAGERWRIEAFQEGKDIYCASASKMFGVPVEKHGVNAELRQKGKLGELSLGYGGSVGALKSMGAIEMGVREEELSHLVRAWRRSNPRIVQFWWDVDRAVRKVASNNPGYERVRDIRFFHKYGSLLVMLPSGRTLSYVHPHNGRNRFGGEAMCYYGLDSQKRWSLIESYGPKYVENIVQAISRDILAYAMRTLRNCRICAHVHDELIIECPEDVTVDEICEKMSQTPPWIEGLNLKAEGYECYYYQKS